MRKTNQKRHTGIYIDASLRRRMLEIGREQDVNNGGYCDARSGVVNFWAGPEDKPKCWPDEIKRGALEHPRDYVGGVYFEYDESYEGDRWQLVIEADPFEMLEDRSNPDRVQKRDLDDEQWEQIMSWLEEKKDKLYGEAAA